MAVIELSRSKVGICCIVAANYNVECDVQL